jgi:phycobilisome core-membrane linker protein
MAKKPNQHVTGVLSSTLYKYSAPFRKVPQFITLFSAYTQPLPDQHVYGSGNDPLEIQFGAIFPKEVRNPSASPAPFSKDTRRLLIRRGPGIDNQVSNPKASGAVPGSLGPKVFKLDQLPGASGKNFNANGSVKFSESSTQAVIRAIYLQLIGFMPYSGQRLTVWEIRLENGDINVREFVRQAAKSSLFRNKYWTSLYVCKAVEYIHRRLLGRPTYGRQEMNKYFDVCAKKGFYALIDSLLGSKEYEESFGEDTVPYERYLTASGVSLRSNRIGTVGAKGIKAQKEVTPRFIELGQVAEMRTEPSIQARINQGVAKRRDQTKVFKLTSLDPVEVNNAARAAYRQVFERDMDAYVADAQFSRFTSKLQNAELTVKEFILAIGTSDLYIKEFYTPFPNTKVIELGTKHFLGRAPLDQVEIRKYNSLLASQGLKAMVTDMVSSREYLDAFGEDTVPYNRYETFPAANFPNTMSLYGRLTKQDASIVVPSFEPVKTKVIFE